MTVHRDLEGERRKEAALNLLAKRRGRYVLLGRRALLTALLDRGRATGDDVRDLVELPSGVNPKLFGSVPAPLVRAGIISPDGFMKTCRPTAHARQLTRWVLADRAKAERWLHDHPEPPDCDDDEAGGGQLLFPFHPTNNPTPAVAAVGVGSEDQ